MTGLKLGGGGGIPFPWESVRFMMRMEEPSVERGKMTYAKEVHGGEEDRIMLKSVPC
jgi:hypothetical protein